MFSGIGGFELGIEQAYEHLQRVCNKGQKVQESKATVGDKKGQLVKLSKQITRERLSCIGYSETNKYAIQIYEKHFKHKNYGDCTKIKAAELPDFDFLVGGFPCQAFSIAGKRKGFNDTRGTLFFDIARILKEKRPRYILLENVKGLLSHDQGRTFKTILSTLTELGYDLQTMVLNSKNFGVPQNRERVFIAGCIGGWGGKQVFSFGETNKKVNRGIRGKRNRLPCVVPKDGGLTLERLGNTVRVDMKIANTVTPDAYLTRGERKRVNGKSVLTSMYERRIRRLTPTECERLQGFPNGWTEGLSDTQRYKTLGNAVTVNVVKEIMKNIL